MCSLQKPAKPNSFVKYRKYSCLSYLSFRFLFQLNSFGVKQRAKDPGPVLCSALRTSPKVPISENTIDVFLKVCLAYVRTKISVSNRFPNEFHTERIIRALWRTQNPYSFFLSKFKL